ncbi:MAG: MliC family protein, partial [Beijerinckiaceae bacterium]
NDKLNIRAEASASARKLGDIPPNADGVKNLGCTGGLSFAQWEKASPAQRAAAQKSRWCRVSFNGVTGWVAGRFLAEGSAPGASGASPSPASGQPFKRALSPDETLQRITVPANGSTSVKGTIRGYKHNVYAVSLAAGETLSVRFDTKSTSAYFNVIDADDGSGAAIHRGEVDGRFATIKANGPKTYLIQPYLVRAVARRGATAAYAIVLSRSVRAAAATGAPQATAPRPSFDCSKADRDTTRLVCTDAMLAALDNETARLFKLAMAGKYMDEARKKELAATERGWIKGRDECWKAKDLRRCVMESYLQRIHELRQGYAGSRTQDSKGISTGPLVLECANFDALIGVTFVQSDPSAAYLQYRNQAHAVVLQPSGSGARYTASYEDGAVSMWTKGTEALLQLPKGPEMKCGIRQPG